jgi:quercetin dioxygenase-like cupin family protein
MKTIVRVLLSVIVITSLSNCNSIKRSDNGSRSEQAIFPKGQPGAATNFTGSVYNYTLVANDSTYNTLVGNVFFEKGARSNWHVHPSGQILIVLDGEGYHQLEGQPRQVMKKGDVIKCPPNVKHWHGATEKSSLTQMYILPKTEKGIVTWLEAVTDDQYKSIN